MATKKVMVCALGMAFTLVTAVGWAQAAPAKARLASEVISPDRMEQYADLAVTWQQEYLRIDTTNPPGNELLAADLFKKILDREGIENQIFTYAPGRADLWARIPHSTTSPKRPLVLLNHMDVVTSDASHWKVPPFSGEILNGSLYGRGAQDMKNEGLAQFMVMVMLKREKVDLDRDVIFLAVSDEEVDGTGTDWFITHQRDLLGDAEFLINEGGENLLEKGHVKYIGVDVGEKAAFWLHVVAHGRAGHGSLPIPDSAPNRLVQALNRIIAYRTPLKGLPVVQEFLLAMGVPHQVIGQPEVADRRSDGDDAQGKLIDSVPFREDEPQQGQLGPESHRQAGELDRVGGEGGAQDALLGRSPLARKGGERR